MKLNNLTLRGMHAFFNNITRNAVFYSSTMVPIDHKKRVFTTELKESLGIPNEIDNWYDYNISLGTDYSRLKMLTIISACSDVEFLLKLFIENHYQSNIEVHKSFYQRLDDVNKKVFIPKGVDLDNEGFFKIIKLAFQVRHIAIHNMGFIDEGFIKNTGLKLDVNTKFIIDDNFINSTFDAIEELILFLDKLD